MNRYPWTWIKRGILGMSELLGKCGSWGISGYWGKCGLGGQWGQLTFF